MRLLNDTKKKILGEERRALLLNWLKTGDEPLTGSLLAEKTNVSRQVIVQDISLLKAKGEPILATSQGYVYIQSQSKKPKVQKVVVVNHSPEETRNELNLIVDCGVTVKDVIIEHPIYGDLTASILVKNRHEVDLFVNKLSETNASLLSELTNGTHIHTLEAETDKEIDAACHALEKAGFLVK